MHITADAIYASHHYLHSLKDPPPALPFCCEAHLAPDNHGMFLLSTGYMKNLASLAFFLLRILLEPANWSNNTVSSCQLCFEPSASARSLSTSPGSQITLSITQHVNVLINVHLGSAKDTRKHYA